VRLPQRRVALPCRLRCRERGARNGFCGERDAAVGGPNRGCSVVLSGTLESSAGSPSPQRWMVPPCLEWYCRRVRGLPRPSPEKRVRFLQVRQLDRRIGRPSPIWSDLSGSIEASPFSFTRPCLFTNTQRAASSQHVGWAVGRARAGGAPYCPPYRIPGGIANFARSNRLAFALAP
jgi:hypothetical protein